MKGFNGFPQKGTLIRIPGQFFGDLLPQIDHLAELKVTLHCFWRLQQKEGQLAFLRKKELEADPVVMTGLASREDDRQAALEDGLERAVVRGTLLHVHVDNNGSTEDLYFMNTPKGRAAVEGIEKGKWFPTVDNGIPSSVVLDHPNIF